MVAEIANIKNAGYTRPPLGKGITSHATNSAKNRGNTGYFMDEIKTTNKAMRVSGIIKLSVLRMYTKTNMIKKTSKETSTVQADGRKF